MIRQTVAEYLREKGVYIQEKICPYCESRLDPDEKCTCPESKGTAVFVYAIIEEDPKSGEYGLFQTIKIKRRLNEGELHCDLVKGSKGYYRILKLLNIEEEK